MNRQVKTKRSRWALAILLSFVVIGAHALYFSTPRAQRFEYVLLDYLFSKRGPITPPDDVVVIAMDESSYQNLGVPLSSGWPRALHTKLLHKLHEAGVNKVLFDILFLGPSEDESADRELAEALRLNPTVIGADEGVQQTPYGNTQELLLPYSPFMKSSTPALVALPEEFGYVRHFRLPESGKRAELQPLAFAAFESNSLASPSPRDMINFYGPPHSLPTYSYYQILETEIPFPLEKLKDKTVFVGLQLRTQRGPDQKDSFLTAFSEYGRRFGLEIHATAAANLLTHNWIRRLAPRAELILLSLFLVVICFACMAFRPAQSGILTLTMGLSWLSASRMLFTEGTFLPGMSVLVVFGPLVYLGSTLLFYFFTRKSQRTLRKAFELYLSPHMAHQVTRNPATLGLGGKKVFATALFTDLAGFTSISEKMSAEEVTHMLNDYFSEVVDIIFEEKGTLIKFIGDAVFAIWNAPVELKNHAEAALRAGLAIRDTLPHSIRLQKYPALHTRIGIHCGPMVVGNLGSRKRFDFTAIGDSVNLASRVEGLNKYLGTSLLITEAVKDALPPSSDLFPMGRVCVLGKTESIMLYTVFSNITAETTAIWSNARAAFESRNWEKAIQAFRKCIDCAPVLTTASEFYIEQSEQYKLLSPSETWKGELILSSK